jgi:hypothetical protein
MLLSSLNESTKLQTVRMGEGSSHKEGLRVWGEFLNLRLGQTAGGRGEEESDLLPLADNAK